MERVVAVCEGDHSGRRVGDAAVQSGAEPISLPPSEEAPGGGAHQRPGVDNSDGGAEGTGAGDSQSVRLLAGPATGSPPSKGPPDVDLHRSERPGAPIGHDAGDRGIRQDVEGDHLPHLQRLERGRGALS